HILNLIRLYSRLLHIYSSSCCHRSTLISTLLSFKASSTTELYTLSLHDALPILSSCGCPPAPACSWVSPRPLWPPTPSCPPPPRSEEHTSELQSRFDLVCRLLLEKKKKRSRKKQCLFNTLSRRIARS